MRWKVQYKRAKNVLKNGMYHVTTGKKKRENNHTRKINNIKYKAGNLKFNLVSSLASTGCTRAGLPC